MLNPCSESSNNQTKKHACAHSAAGVFYFFVDDPILDFSTDLWYTNNSKARKKQSATQTFILNERREMRNVQD